MNVGTVYGGLDNPKLTFKESVNLKVGNNKISLLSVAVGLPVSILFFDAHPFWLLWSHILGDIFQIYDKYCINLFLLSN